MYDDVDRRPVALRVTQRRGVVIAEVRGEIDTDSYRHVRDELLASLDGSTKALVVDLAGVDFLASMGIAVLVEVREHADRLGVAHAVVAGHRTVMRPLQVSQVDALLTLCTSLDEALALVRAQIEPSGRSAEVRGTRFSWWSS